MPTPITPPAAPTLNATVNAPNDGEIANSASLVQFVQPFVDDTEALRLLTYGGGLRRRVACTSNTVLTIQPLGAVVVKPGADWVTLSHSVATIVDPSALAGVLVANTRYWLYAYYNAGVIAFSVSTTGPDAGLRYMTGNTQYFLVSTFWTNAAADIVPYSQTDSEYTYTDASLGDGTQLLNAGAAAVDTDVTLTSTSIPTQASRAYLLIALASSLAQHRGTVKAGAAASPQQYVGIVLQDGAGLGVAVQGIVDCQATAGTICYSVTAGGPAMSIFAMGFSL